MEIVTMAMFNNPESSDFVVKCGEVEFSCHKSVLGIVSPVFRAMFKHNLEESETGQLHIVGVDEASVEIFLRVAYGDVKLERLTFETAKNAIELCHKYDIKAALSDNLTEIISGSHMFYEEAAFAVLANQFDMPNLQRKAVDRLTEHHRPINELGRLRVVERLSRNSDRNSSRFEQQVPSFRIAIKVSRILHLKRSLRAFLVKPVLIQ